MGLKLGDVSPLAGMLTGEGLTGKLIQQGVGGIIPMAIAKSATKSRKEEEEEEAKKKLGPGRFVFYGKYIYSNTKGL
jgi:hypothetical protein